MCIRTGARITHTSHICLLYDAADKEVFIVVKMDGKEIGRTDVREGSNPEWGDSAGILHELSIHLMSGFFFEKNNIIIGYTHS